MKNNEKIKFIIIKKMEIEYDEEPIINENIQSYMDEGSGYYLFVSMKKDNKYHLIHITDEDEINFVIDFGFSTTRPDETIFTLESGYDNLLKRSSWSTDINFNAPIYTETKASERLRKYKRKLENASYPVAKLAKRDGRSVGKKRRSLGKEKRSLGKKRRSVGKGKRSVGKKRRRRSVD